ncbi:MAG: twin-arginine translocation signal domain-containing protein [bacterium]|nr:twin-arginine translocation signal domain-containing protein [bacterium]
MPEQAPTITRRDFIAGTAAAAAGGAAAAKITESFFREVPQKRIYREGDVINVHGAKIRIKGWSLIVDLREMRIPESEFRFELINRPLIERPEIGKYYRAFYSENDNGTLSLSMLPDSSDPVYLLYTQYQYRLTSGGDGVRRDVDVEKIPTAIEIYPIVLTSYAKPDRDGVTRDFYEVNLGSDVGRALHEQRKAFAPFLALNYYHQLYVHDSPSGHSAHTLPDVRQIHIESGCFVNPTFEDEGLVAAFHERSHMVRKTIQDARLLQGAYVHLQNAYESILRLERSSAYKPFQVFTESHYAKNKHSFFSNLQDAHEAVTPMGHPYDDANELFASTATVMRFFPDEFVQKYRSLPGIEKEVAQKAVHAVLGAFCALATGEKELVMLFPKYKRITEAVGFRYSWGRSSSGG